MMLSIRRDAGQAMIARHLCAAALTLVVLFLMWPAFKAVANLGLREDSYVEILAAPFLALFLMYWERDRIFREVRWNPRFAIPVLSVVLAAYFVLLRQQPYSNGSTRLMLAAFALILAWMAVFIFCYGLQSFKMAWFPLCCLLLMIPVPPALIAELTTDLQRGSAATSYQILRLFGVPVLSEGTKFALPGLEIEVAPECSGIHSCLSLVLVGLLTARLFLRYGWTRLAVVASTVPIAIFKNAIRISVIATLGAYVNRAFLFGRIHRYGGLVFTPFAVVLLVLLLLALQKSETWIVARLRSRPLVPERTPTAAV